MEASMETSSFGRLIAVLISPTKTFESICRRPTWVVVLLLLVILSVLTGVLVAQRLDMEEVIRQAVAQRGVEMSDSQIADQVALADKWGAVGAVVSGLALAPLMYLITALSFWVVFKLMGSELEFPQSFSVTLHGFMPWAVASLLSIPVILGRSTLGYEEAQGGLLLSNLGAFVTGEETGIALRTLLASVDVFTLWSLALLTIGFAVCCRRSKSSTAVVTVVMWLIYVAGKVGWATLRS